ncbi:RCKP-type rubredoxin-like domain-containing protein [Desulfuribacillus stibiiarsenatis]
MAVWKCGFIKESRCCSGKCPECGGTKEDFYKEV